MAKRFLTSFILVTLKTIGKLASAFLLLLLVEGCRPQSDTETLTISVAASATDVMNAIAPKFEQKHPNINISYNFAASGTLQQQIEQGAPVDIFLSAGVQPMEKLSNKRLIIEESRYNLLGNKMVLIVPKSEINSLVHNFQELITSEIKRIAIGDPNSVPAGNYGKSVLTSLGVYETLKPKFVFGKDVRQVLTYVETGNADAGLVYQTDAKSSQQVKVVAIAPTESHPPIVYPIALIEGTDHLRSAQQFLTFLKQPSIQAIFESYGFRALN